MSTWLIVLLGCFVVTCAPYFAFTRLEALGRRVGERLPFWLRRGLGDTFPNIIIGGLWTAEGIVGSQELFILALFWTLSMTGLVVPSLYWRGRFHHLGIDEADLTRAPAATLNFGQPYPFGPERERSRFYGVALASAIAFGAIPAILQHRVDWHEGQVEAQMRALATLQQEADEPICSPEVLIERGLADGFFADDFEGYATSFDCSDQVWSVAAHPLRYGETGRRSFYIDTSGVLRADDIGGKPGSERLPKVDKEDDSAS